MHDSGTRESTSTSTNTWKRHRNHCVCESGFSTQLAGNAQPLRRSSVPGKRRRDEAQSPCGLAGVNKPGSRPGTESEKEKKATKMLGICVLMFGVSDSPNSPKLQLVIASSKKIYENSSLVDSKSSPITSAYRDCGHLNVGRGRNGFRRGETIRHIVFGESRKQRRDR